MTDNKNQPQLPFLIGIGASAGGLEALSTMLDSCPECPQAALIAVQHLSPDYESLLPELLSRHTSLRVVHAQDGVVPEPATLYVIRPQTVLYFEDGRIRVKPAVKEAGRLHLPINTLFETLAAERKEQCALVVLSGTGSDGTLGMRAGKLAGAVTVVQSPATARFDGMPRSAIDAGAAELILEPGEILPQLLAIHADDLPADRAKQVASFELALQRILNAVRTHSGVDFANYKSGTILRRVQRRMVHLELSDVREYADRVREDRNEALLLRKELLIGVTRFLRDEGGIEVIRSVGIPRLLASAQGPIRVWVPGCSTGEEAYTLAMLIQDAVMLSDSQQEFRVFATDVDEFAIEHASLGEFGPSIVDQLPEDLLSRYFTQRGDLYTVNKQLRERLLFSRHDLLQDPPFSRIDLVSCRNLLIYLRPQAQERALRLFSNSLRDEGLLWLGASETVGDQEDLFDKLDARWKLYVARVNRKRAMISLNRSPYATETYRQRGPDRMRAVLEELVGACIPPCMVTDESLRLLYHFGGLERLMRLPQGPVSLDIRDFLPNELGGLLSSALGRVREGKELIYRQVQAETTTGRMGFDLRVRRLSVEGAGFLFAFLFESLRGVPEQGSAELLGAEDVSSDTRARIATLEQELRLSRESLQATIEELESSNEELQATNEELVAANEELQSTNEELQSVNEELHTVNAEHGEKLEELGRLNDDLDNLFGSIDVAILFLDAKLSIRRFNAAVTRYFSVMRHDEGRPLAHLSHRLQYSELLDDCAKVLRAGQPLQRRVQVDSEVVVMRLTPHVSQVYGVQGVVLAITDITVAEDNQRQLGRLTEAFRRSPASMCVIDDRGIVAHVNPVFESVSGFSSHDVKGRFWGLNFPEVDRGIVVELLDYVRANDVWRGVLRFQGRNGKEYFELVRLSRTSKHEDAVLYVGEPLNTQFKSYEQLRGKDEPPMLGRPSYSLWGPELHEQLMGWQLPELFGLGSSVGLDIGRLDEFVATSEAPLLAEFLKTMDGERGQNGFRFHLRGDSEQRRLQIRSGRVDFRSQEMASRVLLEVVELAPGPGGWRQPRSDNHSRFVTQ